MRRVRKGDHLSGINTKATVFLVSFPQVRLGALYFATPAQGFKAPWRMREEINLESSEE